MRGCGEKAKLQQPGRAFHFKQCLAGNCNRLIPLLSGMQLKCHCPALHTTEKRQL